MPSLLTIQDNLIKGFGNITVSLDEILPRLPVALLGLLVGILIVKVIGRFLAPALRFTKWPLGLQEIMATLIRVAMWIFLLITILQVLGLTNVALAITGSFAVLLIGFSTGISNTVNDLIAGLQLANDKDFKVGFKVRAGDQKTVGIVREMDIKKTRIESEDGKLHVIPNGVIEKNEWVVLDRHVHSKMPPGSAIMKKVTSFKKKASK
jgi:small-conductance mechanosensitive channel